MAEMMAIGVFSSWLASVMNCFCIREFSSKGLTMRLDKNQNTTVIITMKMTAINESMTVSRSTALYS